MNETQGGVRRDTILDRYSIEPLSSLFCTPAEETALLIKLRRKVISQFMCRSRPSLPRAALLSLPHRRRITLHALLFSASSARTVLFLLFSCSSSSVLRRPPSYPATGGHHRDRPARPSTPTCPGGSTASGGTAQRRTTALQSATTSPSRRRQGWPAHLCSLHPTPARRWNEPRSALRSQRSYTR